MSPRNPSSPVTLGARLCPSVNLGVSSQHGNNTWICDVVGTVWEKSVPVTPFNTPESLRLLVIRKLDDPHIINLGRGNSRSADSGRLSSCFSRLEILGLRERTLVLSLAEGSPIVIVKPVTPNPTLPSPLNVLLPNVVWVVLSFPLSQDMGLLLSFPSAISER